MTILVTGGSRRVGEAIVRALHGAGHSVFFTYVAQRERAEAIVRELGERVICAQCDVGEAKELPALMEACVKRLGSLDVLVNNAAIFEDNPFPVTATSAGRPAGNERSLSTSSVRRIS